MFNKVRLLICFIDFYICLTKLAVSVYDIKKRKRGVAMDFDSINYFLNICNCGSFSEAAKRLYISQPTLSRRITALEDELGTELLSRKSTGISLTPAGKTFYEEQTTLMNSQQRLIERMKSFRQEYAGTLTVGIREELPFGMILKTSMHIKALHPNLDIRILSFSTSELIERYIAGSIDVAYSLRDYFSGHYSGVVETVLKVDPTILIPRSHRLYGVSPLKLSDFIGEKFVIFKRGAGIQGNTLSFFEQHGISFKEALVCNSSSARLSASALNGYLAIGSSYWLERYDIDDLFRTVLVPETNINGADVCIAYQPENLLASRFATHLQSMHFEADMPELESIIID